MFYVRDISENIISYNNILFFFLVTWYKHSYWIFSYIIQIIINYIDVFNLLIKTRNVFVWCWFYK